MRSPSSTSRNHPSLQTRVLVNFEPSHPHDDPGTQTMSLTCYMVRARAMNVS
jgi:hypothetical protein